MKDIFDNEIEIGDTVAFNPPWYKGLLKGKVLRFSSKKVWVEYTDHTKRAATANVFPDDVVVKGCATCKLFRKQNTSVYPSATNRLEG